MCQPHTACNVPILEAYWFQPWASDSVTHDYSIHDFFILSTGLKGLIWGPLSMSCSHIFAGVKKNSWSTFFERGLFVVKTRQWSNPNVRSFRKDKHHCLKGVGILKFKSWSDHKSRWHVGIPYIFIISVIAHGLLASFALSDAGCRCLSLPPMKRWSKS